MTHFKPPISNGISTIPSTCSASPLTDCKYAFLVCNFGFIFRLLYTCRCIRDTSAPESISALNFCFSIFNRQEFGFPVKAIIKVGLFFLHLSPASERKGGFSFPDPEPGLACCQYAVALLSLPYIFWQCALVYCNSNTLWHRVMFLDYF